jgi:MFS family permease/GNAT superfamily N-acetyltransferase
MLIRHYPSLGPGPYRRVWAGVVPYHFAFQIGIVATGSAAVALSPSAFEVGLMVGAWGLPILVLPPVGGVAADRFPRRRTMLLAQVVLGSAALAVGALGLAGLLAVWHVVALGLVQGTVYAFFAPARVAYTATSVDRAIVPNAIAAYSLSEHIGAVVGPVLGGLLIAVRGIGYGGTFVLIAILHAVIFGIYRRLPDQPVPGTADGSGLVSRISAGVRYARDVPALRVVLVVSALAMLLGMPFRQLLPVFSDRVFGAGPAGLGLLLGAAGLGAIGGSIAVARIRGEGQLVRWPGLLGAAFGLAALAFALSPSLAVGVALVTVAGAAAAAFTTTNSAIVATATDAAFYGRTASLYQLTWALGPLGAIPIAALADGVGPPTAVAFGGLLLAIAAPLVAWRLSRGQRPISAGRSTTPGTPLPSTAAAASRTAPPATGPAPAGITIRAAGPADLPAAAALMRQTVEEDFETPYHPSYHRDIADLEAAYLGPPRHTLFIAIDDASGAVVGTGGVRVGRLRGGPPELVRRYAGDDTAQLVRIYVRREARRRGIARAIVGACLEFVLADGGYSIIALHAFPHSPGALSFWESIATRVGYQEHTDIPPEAFFEIDFDDARRIVTEARAGAPTG